MPSVPALVSRKESLGFILPVGSNVKTLITKYIIHVSVFPPSKKKRGGGGGYNFSMRSKQIKRSWTNDHIKGNQVRKGGGGGGAPWYLPLGGKTDVCTCTSPSNKHWGGGGGGLQSRLYFTSRCILPHSQELARYEKAHKAFVYNVHGFESPVGPVKVSRGDTCIGI